MKKILYISFLLITGLSFAQQTYKVTEGEFQFINPNIGIIVKKNNQYFCLGFYSEEKDGKIKHHYNLLNQFDPYINLFRSENIYEKQIDKNSNFKDLNKVCFFEETKEGIYTFYQINKSHFAGFTTTKNKKNVTNERYLPFIIVELNDLKLVVFIDNCRVIYKSNDKYCISTANYVQGNFWVKIQNNIPSLQELTETSTSYDANNLEEYRIQKTKNGKYQIKTILYDEIVKKEYDTIYLQNLIVCKKDNYYDFYNFRFKKISKSGTTAFATFKNKVQIIRNNKLETLNYKGKQYISKQLQPVVDYSKFDEMPHSEIYPKYGFNKLDDGTFNLYLIESDVDLQVQNIDKVILKNLDAVSFTNWGFYKIKKDSLFTYYPLVKDLKYSTLEDFKGKFARFELPNGKKGWLGIDGKEYLDE